MNSSLSGQVTLVTGGSRGIGAACCEVLANSGARVAVNYCRRADAAQEVVTRIQSNGGEALAVQADVTSDADVANMVQVVRDELGPIDCLVNNSGIFEVISYKDTTPEKWQEMIDVNLNGTYRVTWSVIDEMVERGRGTIVNVASIAGLRPRPLSIAYAATKAGMIAMTQGLAQALAPQVRVNAVAPGLIDTDIIADVDQELKEQIVAQTPIPRLGRPDEIAEVVRFLLSDESSFMTGQTLVASGGRVTLP